MSNLNTHPVPSSNPRFRFLHSNCRQSAQYALAAAMIIVSPSLVCADPTEWTGAIDSDFANADNWTNGVPVPGELAEFRNVGTTEVVEFSADATFDGLAEGSTFTIDDTVFQISYIMGLGGDTIGLTVIPESGTIPAIWGSLALLLAARRRRRV